MESESLHVLDLPDHVVSMLLSAWITIQELSRVDAAMCNTANRKSFLRAIRDHHGAYSSESVYLAEHPVHAKLAFVSWLVKREIAVSKLDFVDVSALSTHENRQSVQKVCRFVTFLTDSRLHLYEANLINWVAVVEFGCEVCPNVVAVDFMNSFGPVQYGMIARTWPDLQSITIPMNACEECLKALFRYCKQIKHLNASKSKIKADEWAQLLPSFGASIETFKVPVALDGSDESMRPIVAHCPKLESYEGRYLSSLSVQSLVKGCRHLRDLHLSSCEPFAADLAAIAQQLGPRLRKITFYCGKLTDTDMVSLVQRCPNITELMLLGAGKFTDATYIAIAQHCPQLKKLRMEAVGIGGVRAMTDASILAIAAGCPHLSTLILHWVAVSDDALMTLMRACSGLTVLRLTMCSALTGAILFALPTLCPWITEFGVQHGPKVTLTGMRAVIQQCRHLCSLIVDVPLRVPVMEVVREIQEARKFCPKIEVRC